MNKASHLGPYYATGLLFPGSGPMAEEASIASLSTPATSNPLARLEEASVQNAHHFRKLSKLHEKLNERDRMLSLSGALKLYKAYEGALEGVLVHKRLVDEALAILDDALRSQEPSTETPKMDLDEAGRVGEARDLSDLDQPAGIEMMTTMGKLVNDDGTLMDPSQMTGAPVAAPPVETKLSHSLPLPPSSPPSPSPSIPPSSPSHSSSPSPSPSSPHSHSNSHPHARSRSSPSAPSSLPSDVPEVQTGDNVESGPESTQEGDLDIIGSPGGGRGEGEGTIPVGSTVAVRCRVDEESPAEEWILATIVRGAFTDEDGRWSYEVEDVEFEEAASSPLRSSSVKGSPHKSGGKRPLRLVVSSDQIRKLPATEEEALNSTAGIKVRQRVLALFPGTTCLYAATVISTPARRKKTRDFLLKFSDDDVPSRVVPARYVLRSEE